MTIIKAGLALSWLVAMFYGVYLVIVLTLLVSYWFAILVGLMMVLATYGLAHILGR